MRQLSFILFLTIISVVTLGQTDRNKRNSVYLEVAGSGGLGSINYEELFWKRNNTEFTWRAGLSFAPIDRNNGVGIVFPLMINSIIGANSHKLEVGVGQGVTVTTKGKFFALSTAAIGYRYQSDSKKLFYRVAYTPLVSYLIDFQVQHWAGISVGYTFKNLTK
jgi:hypothetical protein